MLALPGSLICLSGLGRLMKTIETGPSEAEGMNLEHMNHSNSPQTLQKEARCTKDFIYLFGLEEMEITAPPDIQQF